MADTATAASTAAASKKKYRNKNKKSQQHQQQQQQQQHHHNHHEQKSEREPAEDAVKVAGVLQANGHVQTAEDADVALINGIMQQVQLCNGHAKDKAETLTEMPRTTAAAKTGTTVASTLNGHVTKSVAINNNNHINNNNNNNNSNSNNNNNVNNNNTSSSSSRNKNNNNNSSNNSSSSSKVKNNNKSQTAANSLENQHAEQETKELEQQTSVVATSKSTANTQTTSATTTKTTAMAIATRGTAQDEAPTTSAAAAAAAASVAALAQPQQQQQEALQQTQPQTQTQPDEQSQLQLEPAISADEIVYKEYEAEHQMHDIMRLIQAELSEPYSIYTYRYFIYNWPKLCFLASHDNQYVGAIVCKLDMHMNVRRGYIAMLAVRKEYRKLKIGTTLVTKAIEAMLADNADEVVLETEMRNEPALRLYENLGFVRDKRLFRYYLNGVDALRLKLWFR